MIAGFAALIVCAGAVVLLHWHGELQAELDAGWAELAVERAALQAAWSLPVPPYDDELGPPLVPYSIECDDDPGWLQP